MSNYIPQKIIDVVTCPFPHYKGPPIKPIFMRTIDTFSEPGFDTQMFVRKMSYKDPLYPYIGIEEC